MCEGYASKNYQNGTGSRAKRNYQKVNRAERLLADTPDGKCARLLAFVLSVES